MSNVNNVVSRLKTIQHEFGGKVGDREKEVLYDALADMAQSLSEIERDLRELHNDVRRLRR